MCFIRKHNDIPVPKILYIHEVDASYHLWMEFIDGVEMTELTEEEETEVLPQGDLHMSSKTH
jgi:tRNA A-37 threonylcarbamoyl transferase component Bud32